MAQFDLTDGADRPIYAASVAERAEMTSGLIELTNAEARVATLATDHASHRGALLPLLHAIQDEFGYVDDRVVPIIASALNISRAEIHGVITFYHDFRRQPAGRHVVKFCRAESCQARGGAAIEAALTERLGVRIGETRGDGQVTLDAVYCLGLCAVGPSALIDGRPIARIDAAAIERLAKTVSA